MPNFYTITPNIYKSVYASNNKLNIIAIDKLIVLKEDKYPISYFFDETYTAGKPSITLTLPDKTQKLISTSYYSGGIEQLKQAGTYLLNYKGRAVKTKSNIEDIDYEYEKINLTYYFSVVENKLPLKKWTITDVINRLLDIAEPIRKGEKPRFRLNAEQANLFDKIIAPQFSFTKQTLRECLQEVGKFVHGEPRLTPVRANVEVQKEGFNNGEVYIGTNNILPYRWDKNYCVFIDGEKYPLEIYADGNGADDEYYFRIVGQSYAGTLTVYEADNYVWYFEVSYDMYASQDKSGICFVPTKLKNWYSQVESYTAYLDTNAENLVNQLDKYSGVIIEPYAGGAKTVRTENLYVRIDEGNMFIPTQYPIYSVEKLEFVWGLNLGPIGSFATAVDITPWLFERSVYDTELSSYSEQYPYSKAYALYYKQGEKNIGGLNFKVDDAVFPAFKNYAIVNIYKQATGSDSFPANYPTMAFRVTYTPIYNARVGQTKVNYKDFSKPAGLIFNQTSNIVESRYFGENLKGAIARLGNVELSLTYTLARITQIPKAGQRFNDDFYISTVAVEYLPTCIKCTIGLSKDFNRLSQYIGINSEKRYSEISQTQAVERNTLWREYVVIGDKEEPDKDALIGQNMLSAISQVFNQEGETTPLSNVVAWGTSYKDNDLNAVYLPVISSAFGNSISFSWKYEDNYSAGAVAHYENVENGPKGFFQDNCRYTDYYGRIYYYNFDLQSKGPEITGVNYLQVGTDLPQGTKVTQSSGYISTVGKTPYILRKDNREALQCNFQIDFVTNTDIIIGSALASYCPAVRGIDKALASKLYVFPTDLNKFTDHIEAWEDVDLSKLPSMDVTVSVQDGYFTVNAENFPASGNSWAIVTAQTPLPAKQVEDEFGNVSTQREVMGGDLLIGQNKEITAGQAFTPIYFTKKRKIFDETDWKDRR